jgi:hypothetical protein
MDTINKAGGLDSPRPLACRDDTPADARLEVSAGKSECRFIVHVIIT